MGTENKDRFRGVALRKSEANSLAACTILACRVSGCWRACEVGVDVEV
jgi:hypothetical protein